VSNQILAPISVGELFDKITILEIKLDNTNSLTKLANIRTELNKLNELKPEVTEEVIAMIQRLKRVNQVIWNIEDEIRVKEQNFEFSASFIELARNIYKNNDLRAEIKREINLATDSLIIEEKIY
jgi:hypothetical protein